MAGFPAPFGDTLGGVVSAGRPPLRAIDGGCPNLLTVSEIAARLALSHATVYRMLERGDIPCVSIGRSLRVAGVDLDAFLARRQRGGRS
jgi:excisionase family DNA binding protein